jgi:hypothetical protein
MLGNPLATVLPYAELGRGALGPNATPTDRILQALGPLGLAPGPVATIPLMATGMASELPADLMRTSAYMRGASTMLTGRETDPEAITKQALRSTRSALGQAVEPTVTGDFLKDRMIRQRIAELSVEVTGKPPGVGQSNPYRAAMDDPESAIWKRAQREVERQRAGEQIGTTTLLPFRTKFLSDTESDLRRHMLTQGTTGTQISELVAQPATPAEVQAATRELRTRPLAPGETLDKRIINRRLSARFQTAAKADPRSMALSLLGGQEKDILNRQREAYFAFAARVRRMSPKRRAPLLNNYLADKPVLRRWLGESMQF